jgi:hypothetical protein
MPFFPYGTLPGETDATHVHIPKRVWWLLRNDPQFLKNWNSSNLSRRYHLAVACLTRGLSDDQTLTILRIWHRKHGHTFYEDEFWTKTYRYAFEYSEPFILRYKAQAYWDEIRRIQGDSKARQHSRLRVAYFLLNTDGATAKEIHEGTRIPIKTVRNCLASLQADGKVEMESYGVYVADRGFFWDRVNVVEGAQGRYTWDGEHPAMYSFAEPYEIQKSTDGGCRMNCYDYCRDCFSTILFDVNQGFLKVFPNPGDSEWVVNSEGDVVENGTGLLFRSLLAKFEAVDVIEHGNGNRLDFSKANLKVTGRKSFSLATNEPTEDFFARLGTGQAA